METLTNPINARVNIAIVTSVNVEREDIDNEDNISVFEADEEEEVDEESIINSLSPFTSWVLTVLMVTAAAATTEGATVGVFVGGLVGVRENDGAGVGNLVGAAVGIRVGTLLGANVGAFVGTFVGASVGILVGA